MPSGELAFLIAAEAVADAIALVVVDDAMVLVVVVVVVLTLLGGAAVACNTVANVKRSRHVVIVGNHSGVACICVANVEQMGVACCYVQTWVEVGACKMCARMQFPEAFESEMLCSNRSHQITSDHISSHLVT